MSSNVFGTNISLNEVTKICQQGFWFIVDNKEYFIPFADYPLFKEATIQQIFNVQLITPTQLFWPDLDADIELEALENPEKFPLYWKE